MIFRARARSRWWTSELRPGIPAKVDYAWNAALQVGSLTMGQCHSGMLLPGLRSRRPYRRVSLYGQGSASAVARQALEQAFRCIAQNSSSNTGNPHGTFTAIGCRRLSSHPSQFRRCASRVFSCFGPSLVLWCLLVLASGCTWPIESRRVEVFAKDQQLNITRQDRGVLG